LGQVKICLASSVGEGVSSDASYLPPGAIVELFLVGHVTGKSPKHEAAIYFQI